MSGNPVCMFEKTITVCVCYHYANMIKQMMHKTLQMDVGCSSITINARRAFVNVSDIYKKGIVLGFPLKFVFFLQLVA